MEEHENLYDKIQHMLGGDPVSLKILEESIDMDLQVEYYECSLKMKEEADDDWALDHIQYLGESGYSDSVKKDILAKLASMERVECYRAIESYAADAEGTMRNWALLALNESRMHLEGGILEENQVFISTGLGGKDQKLRYFVVLKSANGASFTESQKMVIGNEFEVVCRRFEAEIEDVSFSANLSAVLLLVPMNHSLHNLFNQGIKECNHYGNFLAGEYIVTNVRKLSFPEIEKFLEQKLRKKSDRNGI